MGNSLGGRKTTKVMKINGETIKYTKPVQAGEIMKEYPGMVLLESEAVKHFGIRAKPLEPQQELKPKRLYFLVELPKLPEEKSARRVRSGIQMSAKDRLESLLLSRRSTSDLSLLKSSPSVVVEESRENLQNGVTRLKMRLTKAEVEKLMRESKDENEAAEKIMNLCMANKDDYDRVGSSRSQSSWSGNLGIPTTGLKTRERRVGFMPINEGEIQLVTAS